MRTPLLALLLVISLLVPASLAQTGRSEDDVRSPTAEDRRGSAGEDDEEDGDDGVGGSDDRDDGDDRRRGPGPRRGDQAAAIGAFALSTTERVVEGDYVSFTYNDSDLRDFQVGGVPLFDLHVSGDGDDEDENAAVARGAQVQLETPLFRLHVHDNPGGVLKLDTDGIATILFAEGTNLTRVGDERVAFRIGNLTGSVRGEDLDVAGRSIIGRDEILVLVHATRGSFDVHRDDIGEAVGKRHVGAEASFNRRDDDGVEQDVVSYGNVTLHTVKAERGNLTLLIDGHGFDGRVLVLNVDGRIVGASKADDLSVLFDNETITLASSIQDVLDPDDDGLAAEYYVVFDPAEEAFQLLVSVPHYSLHTLSVTTLLQSAPPSVIAGVIGGVVLLAASGVVLFRRKP